MRKIGKTSAFRGQKKQKLVTIDMSIIIPLIGIKPPQQPCFHTSTNPPKPSIKGNMLTMECSLLECSGIERQKTKNINIELIDSR
jgi:hypothetical protein